MGIAAVGRDRNVRINRHICVIGDVRIAGGIYGDMLSLFRWWIDGRTLQRRLVVIIDRIIVVVGKGGGIIIVDATVKRRDTLRCGVEGAVNHTMMLLC